MLFLVPTLLLAAAWVLLALDVEPVPTWFYVFAWYPTLVILDGLAHRLDRRALLLGQPRRALSLLAWSAVIWLGFEAVNFRIENWYYVFVPRGAAGWVGILLSFATVVPALVLAARALEAAGVGERWRVPPLRIRPWELRAAAAVGLAMLGLALAWPQRFFPLVWGGVWLVADSVVYRRRPEWSLLGDLTQGRAGRVGRLLVGGLGIGLLWELYNFWARSKWIYTVPWLEELTLFEMPVLGFLGFPLFALEAWALYHLLCVLGVAVPVSGEAGGEADHIMANGRSGRRAVRIGAAALAALFSALVLAGMERRTISSFTPRLTELPSVDGPLADALRRHGVASVFALARVPPDAVAARTGVPPDHVDRAVRAARLATLRGIGTEHIATLWGIGVRSVCALARAEPERLWRVVRLRRPERHRPTPAEVRVWVAAALEACDDDDGDVTFSPS